MPKRGEYIDLTGKRFGKLTVIELHEIRETSYGKRVTRWKCICDCGSEKVIDYTNLHSGHAKSCGCYLRETAAKRNKKTGLSQTKLYSVYKNMKHRCFNEKNINYKNYGGRGITVCEEWLGENGFKNFSDWALANGYSLDSNRGECTIDRVDVNGNYEPANCRFISNDLQAKNKRNTLTEKDINRVCPICGNTFRITQRTGSQTCGYKCGANLRILKKRSRNELQTD